MIESITIFIYGVALGILLTLLCVFVSVWYDEIKTERERYSGKHGRRSKGKKRRSKDPKA